MTSYAAVATCLSLAVFLIVLLKLSLQESNTTLMVDTYPCLLVKMLLIRTEDSRISIGDARVSPSAFGVSGKQM
jgi:hypothetical protein